MRMPNMITKTVTGQLNLFEVLSPNNVCVSIYQEDTLFLTFSIALLKEEYSISNLSFNIEFKDQTCFYA